MTVNHWRSVVYNAAKLMVHLRPGMIVGALLLVLASICAKAQRGMDDADLEVKMGEQVYRELEAKGEILHESKLYETLNPIAAAIKNVVQPKYDHPFKFYLVHEKQPNAFAAPGGNVYVTDSLMYFVKNTEQLAGTICHETSHTLHHDAVNLMKQDEQIKRRAMAAEIIMERRGMEPMAVPVVAKLRTLGYSREAESRADLTGSDTCAASGYNPWGLVWLLQEFEDNEPQQKPQLLSDHPNDVNRIAALKQHFAENPATFGMFNADPKSATALSPKPPETQFFSH